VSDLYLVTDGPVGGARSTLAGVRALAEAGHRSVVAVSGGSSMAAVSRHCGGSGAVPAATDPGFASAVHALAASHGAVGVLAGSDAALLALGAPVRELLDKARLAERAAEAGFATPPTERVADRASLFDRAGDLPYPIVVKTPVSRMRARRIDGPDQLRRLTDDGPFAVQPFLEGAMEAVAGVIRGGRLVAIMRQRYLRTWPVHCGTSCAAISVDGDPAVEARLPRLLEGYEGIFQVQFRDGSLLDVNPRVYGSLPLAVGTGVNLAALHADLLAGRPAPESLQRGRPGVRYRWIDGDVRHLLATARAGGGFASALAALMPRPGTVHSICRLRDPAPAILRLRVGLRRRR